MKRLQKMLRDINDPKARQQIQKAIGDLMTTVAEAAKNDIGASDPKAPGMPGAPAAPKPPAANEKA